MLRTHTCGELTSGQINQRVVLAGWVQNRRDLGGILFIDLRDRYGITQLVFDLKVSKEAWETANTVRGEYVIQAMGVVVARAPDLINKKISTGTIEVHVQEVTVLNTSKTLPFPINAVNEEAPGGIVNEDLRLQYRFLDLRNKRLQRIVEGRDQVITYIREYLHKHHFIEVQTPILANSSPEGARDFVVPSRLHPGKFYALPQAPQQFKQLLMVAGLDRYFQIAPCFRDEDPRADRHAGDFYQVDFEMSFVEQEDVWNIAEPLMVQLIEKFSNKTVLCTPFPRLSYKEAMEKYGSDKPDLRFDLVIHNLTDIFLKAETTIIAEPLKQGGVLHAIHIEQGASLISHMQMESLATVAMKHGVRGLIPCVVVEKGLKSSISKHLPLAIQEECIAHFQGKQGDLIFLCAGPWLPVCKALGAVRDECGKMLNLKDPKQTAWVWISDFPMYEEENGKIVFCHNPFSMPQGGLTALKTKPPLEILACQYDLVCNGFEVASGAIRNCHPETMYKTFEIAAYTREEVDKKFGHMIRAFEYGAPPHGGMAPGLDRILMILYDCPSIRDIYAFPKNSNAQDSMLNSPSELDEKQLKELHISLHL